MDRTSAPGWEAVAAASLDGVGLVRDGAYVRGNDRLAAVYGFEDPEELRGADWTDLHEFEHPVDAGEVESSSLGRVTVRDESRVTPDPSSDEAPPIDAEDVIQRARATGSWRGSGRVHRQDGGTAPALLSLRTADEGLVVVVRALAGERDVPDAPGSAGRAGQAETTGRSGPDDPPERPPTVTELEFRVIDRASLLVALSDDLDCTLTLAGSVPADRGWLLYLDLEGATGAAAVDATRELDRHARVVTDEGPDRRIEVAAPGPSLFETARAGGGTVQSAEATSGTVSIVVTLPARRRVRAFVNRVVAAFPATELVARRERDRPPARPGAPDDYLGDLTDRQRRALEVAYRSGYFDWPRESTAEEVAAVLDVAPPTLHAHLRKAEARLFAALLDGR
jgi:hypothetical protein